MAVCNIVLFIIACLLTVAVSAPTERDTKDLVVNDDLQTAASRWGAHWGGYGGYGGYGYPNYGYWGYPSYGYGWYGGWPYGGYYGHHGYWW